MVEFEGEVACNFQINGRPLTKPGETTLRGICDSNPARKLLWEHESQIRLYRLASLSYSTPDTYIHVTKSSLRISFYPVQRNTPLPFVKSENPSSKMRAENFKGLEVCSRITRYSCVIYFCLDIIPVMKLFPRWCTNVFSFQ